MMVSRWKDFRLYTKQFTTSTRTAVFLGLLACVSWTIGCGPVAPPSGSVSGKVIFNGQPLTSGVVTLVNEESGVGASVEIDSSGSYYIQSIRTGEYNVAVHNTPPPPGGKFVKLNIPEKYQDILTSGLKATVEDGENTVDFRF